MRNSNSGIASTMILSCRDVTLTAHDLDVLVFQFKPQRRCHHLPEVHAISSAGVEGEVHRGVEEVGTFCRDVATGPWQWPRLYIIGTLRTLVAIIVAVRSTVFQLVISSTTIIYSIGTTIILIVYFYSCPILKVLDRGRNGF